MTYIIKSESGRILTKDNGQYLVFDTATDAMIHIDTVCQGSLYLKPVKLYSNKSKYKPI